MHWQISVARKAIYIPAKFFFIMVSHCSSLSTPLTLWSPCATLRALSVCLVFLCLNMNSPGVQGTDLCYGNAKGGGFIPGFKYRDYGEIRGRPFTASRFVCSPSGDAIKIFLFNASLSMFMCMYKIYASNAWIKYMYIQNGLPPWLDQVLENILFQWFTSKWIEPWR